jgi:DNA-binding transcriptional LysR family regulator
MNIRQLAAFVAVFEERNITAAAHRLCLSQPALSTTIKNLESVLGAQLFERVPRGVAVTDVAHALYPRARRLTMEMDLLRWDFSREQEPATLDIGVSQDISTAEVEVFVEMVRAALPKLIMKLRVGDEGDLWLGSEEHCGPDDTFLSMWSDPYVLAVPSRHELARKSSFLSGTLPEGHWVTFPSHPSYPALLAFSGRSADRAPAAQAESFALALSLVAAGVGVGYAPQSMVNQQPGLIGLSVPGLDLTRSVGLCMPRASSANAAVVELTERLTVRMEMAGKAW